MATSAEARALTKAHQRAQIAIGAFAAAIVDESWRMLDLANLDASSVAWSSVLLSRLSDRFQMSERVARTYITEFRGVELGTTEGVLARPALDSTLAQQSMLIAGPVTTKRLIGAGVEPEQALSTAKRNVYGRFQVWSMSGGRQTVLETARMDERSRRVRRVTDGNPCAWCALMVARSIQMPGSMPATFKTHPHCGCTNEVVYGPPGEQRIDDDEWKFVEAYEQAAKQARAAGESVVAPSGRRRRDTVLWRMRRNRPDLFNDGVHNH